MSDSKAIVRKHYGQWAGDPVGHLEDLTRCHEEVWPSDHGGGWTSYQCSRKRGHGKDGLYCWQHAKSHPAPPKESK